MTDSQTRRSARQRNVPVPSASTSHQLGGARRAINGTPSAEIFTRAGAMPFELTRDEAVRADETLGISWQIFSRIFGGQWRAEWLRCSRIPGYQNILCADITAQPYVPTAPGKPGLVLCLPNTISTPRDDGHTFHVFSSRDSLLYYQGEYAMLHQLQVELDWNDLSSEVSVSKSCYMILDVSDFGCSASTCG